MKTYKLYAGMTGEFEILNTNAPESVVIGYIIAAGNMSLPDDDPEKFSRIADILLISWRVRTMMTLRRKSQLIRK